MRRRARSEIQYFEELEACTDSVALCNIIYIYICDAAGEPWDWADAGYKLAGAVLIVAGNYAYFEYRSAARSAAGLQPLEPEAFEV